MNSYEKNEIERLPEKYRPISPWGYWGYQILFSIPIAGFIVLIVFAFSKDNINRRNFARSYFYIIVAGIIIALIVGVILLLVMPSLARQY